MDFSAALTILKDGGLVQRKGWGRAYVKMINGVPHWCFESTTLSGATFATTDVMADDWHLAKPEEVGLDPSDSGKILHGDEVNAVPLPTNVVPIKEK